MENPRDHVHIAIIGAGIGGLALAIGLLKKEVSFTIYEAAPEFSAVGAGVIFGPNALQAMGMIDPELKARYVRIATGNSSPEKIHVFHDMLLNEEGFGTKQGWEGASIAYDYYTKSSAHRKDLLDVMKSLIPSSLVKFNKKAAEISQIGERVSITFADGEIAQADAVIGCDGGKGASRFAVLGEDHPDKVHAKYSGRYVYRTIVPMKQAREILGDYAGDGKMFMGHGRYFASYQMSQGTQLNMLAARQTSEPWTHSSWTHEVTQQEMLDDFKGCDPRLVKLLDWAKPIRWSLHHHPSTPTYFNTRICLLGDSAHASTPHQGAGAGQCLEDAVILSHLLSLLCRPPKTHISASPVQPLGSTSLINVFRIYDSIVRPRAQEMVRTSDAAGKMYCFTDPECGSDFGKIVANARERFHWIWRHDLAADVRRAEEEFWKAEREVEKG